MTVTLDKWYIIHMCRHPCLPDKYLHSTQTPQHYTKRTFSCQVGSHQDKQHIQTMKIGLCSASLKLVFQLDCYLVAKVQNNFYHMNANKSADDKSSIKCIYPIHLSNVLELVKELFLSSCKIYAVLSPGQKVSIRCVNLAFCKKQILIDQQTLMCSLGHVSDHISWHCQPTTFTIMWCVPYQRG